MTDCRFQSAPLVALRESADGGRYLVFPAQFKRDYEDAPEPNGKAVVITFDGPVQSLYSTLAVRLGHRRLFTTGRADQSWGAVDGFFARSARTWETEDNVEFRVTP